MKSNRDSLLPLNKYETNEIKTTENDNLNKEIQNKKNEAGQIITLINNTNFNPSKIHNNNKLNINSSNINMINSNNLSPKNINNKNINSPNRKSSFDPFSNIFIFILEKVNIVQVAPTGLLPNDENFSNNKQEKNDNIAIRSVVLPRINTPTFKNTLSLHRNNLNFDLHNTNNSNANNGLICKLHVQKNIRYISSKNFIFYFNFLQLIGLESRFNWI